MLFVLCAPTLNCGQYEVQITSHFHTYWHPNIPMQCTVCTVLSISLSLLPPWGFPPRLTTPFRSISHMYVRRCSMYQYFAGGGWAVPRIADEAILDTSRKMWGNWTKKFRWCTSQNLSTWLSSVGPGRPCDVDGRCGDGDNFAGGFENICFSLFEINCFCFSPKSPLSPSFTTLSIRAEFLGRREAAGRDSLNQSRPHKRNFLKL